jgi:hypothetical protein
MKGILALVVSAATLSVASSAQVQNVSGTWELEMFWPEGKSTGTCTFEQEDNRITGTCGGADKFPVMGRVEDNRLSWQFDVQQDGSTGRMTFSGELIDNGMTIRGACSIVGLNDGTFTMKRRQ